MTSAPDDRAGRLYDFLVDHPEGVTRHQISVMLGDVDLRRMVKLYAKVLSRLIEDLEELRADE